MESMDTTTEKLDDLLHKAEQLTTIIDGNIEMPRIERNFKQLLEACDQMYARTSSTQTTKDASNDIRASILLGTKGFDLQKVSQQLEILNQLKKPTTAAAAAAIQIETETDSNIKGFLKKEYENLIIKNVENVRLATIDLSEKFYLNFIEKEWEDQKSKILNALVGSDDDFINNRELASTSFDLTLDSSSIGTGTTKTSTKFNYFDKTFIDKSTITSMNSTEMAFAKEIIKYVDQFVTTSIKSDLTQTFYSLAQNLIGESAIIDLWTMISTLLSLNDLPEIITATTNDPLIRRKNLKLNHYFLKKSCIYLEKKFIKTMQGIVNTKIEENLTTESIYELIRDYLNIKTPFFINNSSYQQQQFTSPSSASIGFSSSLNNTNTNNKEQWEDELIDGIPLWCFIFYCLRSGSIDSAILVVQKIRKNLQLKNDLLNILRDYKLNTNNNNDGFYLSKKIEEQLRLQYQKSIRLSNDLFKKSCYSIFARCAHEDFYQEIFDKVDDFLWIKLKKVSISDLEIESTATTSSTSSSLINQDRFDLNKFKKEILEELGENYFEAQEQPFLYFRALFLTLQWEAAIEFLFRFESYRCYAIHLALILHEQNLLIPSQHIKLSILTKSVQDPPGIQRLNLAKLISIYTKKFQQTNTVDVVYYYYFLNDIQSSTTSSAEESASSSSSSLFNLYVSQLVRETKQYDLLLGYINQDGIRIPGAIDKFNLDVSLIITQVALDLEQDGYFEDACHLYDLAGNHNKVLSLLNKMLSPLVSQQKNSNPKRDKIEQFAIEIAERYCNQKCMATKELKSTFYLLIDLMTFFDYYHNQQYTEALDTIIKLNIFPLSSSEIDNRVDEFSQYSEEIRRNIPDLLLATMDILCAQYKEIKTSIPKVINKFGFIGDPANKDQLCQELRKKAKSLITFAGMVPYRMPGDVNAKLIQLESSMT